MSDLVGCYKTIPRNVQVREALIWLGINTGIVIAYQLHIVLKAALKVSKAEGKKLSNDNNKYVELLVLTALVCLYIAIVGDCWQTEPFDLLSSAYLVIPILIGSRVVNSAHKTIFLVVFLPFVLKGIYLTYWLTNYSTLMIVSQGVSVVVAFVSLVVNSNSIQKLLKEVPNVKVLGCWLLGQVGWTVVLVIAFVSKRNIDHMLCPSVGLATALQSIVPGSALSSACHSYRSVLSIALAVMCYVGMEIMLKLSLTIVNIVNYFRETPGDNKRKPIKQK